MCQLCSCFLSLSLCSSSFEWMNEWLVGWLDEWVNGCACVCIYFVCHACMDGPNENHETFEAFLGERFSNELTIQWRVSLTLRCGIVNIWHSFYIHGWFRFITSNVNVLTIFHFPFKTNTFNERRRRITRRRRNRIEENKVRGGKMANIDKAKVQERNRRDRSKGENARTHTHSQSIAVQEQIKINKNCACVWLGSVSVSLPLLQPLCRCGNIIRGMAIAIFVWRIKTGGSLRWHLIFNHVSFRSIPCGVCIKKKKTTTPHTDECDA